MVENKPDVEGKEGGQYKDKVLQLVTRLSDLTVTSYRVWLVAARFFNAIGDHTQVGEAQFES